MDNKPVKVAIGLSGGVDSSVAAALLKENGYDVIGLSMEIYDGSITIHGSGKHACYGPDEKDDIASAAKVCEKLKIPFHVIDLKKEFGKYVIEYFRNEYLKGRTPNPCIECNQRLKFGFMLKKAKDTGIVFDKFATGHYARITESDRGFLLKKSLDASKDQSYFLYTLTQEQLPHTMLPLGEYTKNEVRDLARSIGLETSERPESQDFISGGDYSHFFNSGEIKEGDIVNEKGDILGRHKGIIHYTIGQRKGLGISSPAPVYVAKIDSIKNRIMVSDRTSLYSKGLIVYNVNLIATHDFNPLRRAKVKIRLQHEAAFARLKVCEEDCIEVIFEEPQLSVTPGQSAVFYEDDIVIGGGIIESAIK